MLKKEFRISKKRDIDNILKTKGQINNLLYFRVKIIKNNLFKSRFLISVSKKYSKKAVERNKVKRRLSAIIYELLKLRLIPIGLDYHFIIKKDTKILPFQGIQEDIHSLLKLNNI
jgi:ribonuclease P protein component